MAAKWTHSVIANDGRGPVVVAALQFDERGNLKGSSARWSDRSTMVSYFEAKRFRWAVAVADGGKAFGRGFGINLLGGLTFEATSRAPGAIVIRRKAG